MQDRSLAIITHSLDEYARILKLPKLTEASSRSAAENLLRAIRTANAMPSFAGYDALLDFFREHRDGIGSDRIALTGVITLDAPSFTLVSTVYTTIRWIIMRVGRRPDARNCAALTRSERFATWSTLPTTLAIKK